jgi:uncharacterized protein
VDLRGVSVHTQILRGIGRLKEARISFSAIAVVNTSNIAYPQEMYDFFASLGCRTVGFNIEEMEGVNTKPDVVDAARVTDFWKGILAAWSDRPTIRIREVTKALSFARAVFEGRGDSWHTDTIPAFPTIRWNGDVNLLSPELGTVKSEKYLDFVAGNVLEVPLVDIVRHAMANRYVTEFLAGVKRCQATCSYFNFCKGGQASNKFHELGTTDATETAFCRNSKQRLIDAVIQ